MKSVSLLDRLTIEHKEDWRGWCQKIPFIKWPATWHVKAIPPFAGAMVRYIVKTPNNPEVSIYLDVHNSLGFFDGPYWEVYPVDGDTFRCEMNNIKDLLKNIKRSTPR